MAIHMLSAFLSHAMQNVYDLLPLKICKGVFTGYRQPSHSIYAMPKNDEIEPHGVSKDNFVVVIFSLSCFVVFL